MLFFVYWSIECSSLKKIIFANLMKKKETTHIISLNYKAYMHKAVTHHKYAIAKLQLQF